MTPVYTIAALVLAVIAVVGLTAYAMYLRSALFDARKHVKYWRNDATRNSSDALRWCDRALVAEAKLAPFITPRKRNERGQFVKDAA